MEGLKRLSRLFSGNLLAMFLSVIWSVFKTESEMRENKEAQREVVLCSCCIIEKARKVGLK